MSEEPDLSSHNFYKPFTAYIAGFIVPMVTGILSACSSGLIIYIISRSQQKLSTTYHRIMAFMSAFDIISSIFIALGTIMMPSDSIYQFAGPLLGNQVTCQMQGWFIVFGIAGGTSLNACLTWYFVCSIVFKMKASQIRKYIEPFMYIYAVIIAMFGPSFALSKDLLNPSAYDTFCTIVPYPESCDEDKWYDWNRCTWSEGDLEKYFRVSSIAMSLIGLHLSLVVIGMSIILWTTFRNNREINSLIKQNAKDQTHEPSLASRRNSEVEANVQSTDSLKYSRVLILQALMYIGASILTWLFNILTAAFVSSIKLDVINSVLFPLQGFWNLLIFLYDKTYLIRQNDENDHGTSFWVAVKQVLSSPSDVPTFVLSSISIVQIEPGDEDGLNDQIAPNTERQLEEIHEYHDENCTDEVSPCHEIVSEYDHLSILRDGNMSEKADSSMDLSGIISFFECKKIINIVSENVIETNQSRKYKRHRKDKMNQRYKRYGKFKFHSAIG